MNYWRGLGNVTSQWLNALSGGDGDIPMSGRVGYYSHMHSLGRTGYRFFLLIEKVIDTAFYPLDGKGHCQQAYYRDLTELYDKGSVISCAAVSLLSVTFSLFLMPFTWSYYLIKQGLN